MTWDDHEDTDGAMTRHLWTDIGRGLVVLVLVAAFVGVCAFYAYRLRTGL